MTAVRQTHSRRTRKWWRDRYVADHYAKIRSPHLLLGFMQHKGVNNTDFAKAVDRRRYVQNGKTCSRATISYLVNGKMHTCEVDLAECIEAELDLPPGTVFDVLAKSRDKRGNGKQEQSEVSAA